MINFADIAIILIFVIFCIIGYARGFMRSLTKLMGSFVSLIIAMLLCNWVCSLICLTPLDDMMLDHFVKVYSGMGGSINVTVDGTNTAPLMDGLVGIGIPSFIAKLMVPALVGLIPSGTVQAISVLLAGYTVQIIMVFSVTLILFIIVRLFVKLINFLIHLILKDRLLKIVDRLLGFAFGAVKAFLCVFIVFVLGGYFVEQPYAVSVKEQITSGSISSVLYENNPVKSLWDKYVNFNEIFDFIKNKIGVAGEAEEDNNVAADEQENTVADEQTSANGAKAEMLYSS